MHLVGAPVNTEDGPIFLPSYDKHFADLKHRRLAAYQQPVYRMALEEIPANKRKQAVDIGAHIGLWTRRMANDFESVLAIEPESENFECLSKNTSHYKNVTCIRLALGSSSGFCTMQNPSKDNSGAWELMHCEPKTENAIPLRRLDDLLPLLTPSLIKVDCQGLDFEILCGSALTLSLWHPVVVAEVRVKGIEKSEIGDFLKGLGYAPGAFRNKDQVFIFRG